jgi:NADH:ubiquinone oxidoreductase subunit 6 (subunit J)
MAVAGQMADTLRMDKTGKPAGSWGFVTSWKVMRRSLVIALIVGVVLSVSNQFDVILREPMNARLAAKIFSNFCIPFIVASVSALLNRQRH